MMTHGVWVVGHYYLIFMRRLFLIMFSAIAIAATAQDTVAVVRIGYIDKQLFINSMPEMQAVQADLQRLKGSMRRSSDDDGDVQQACEAVYSPKG